MAPRTSPAAKKADAPKILSLAEIEAAEDRPIETVEVPEWGGAVKIQAMSLRQKQDIRVRSFDGDGEFSANLWEDNILVECLLDPSISHDQLGILKDKNGAAVERISTAIVLLNKAGGAGLESALQTFL